MIFGFERDCENNKSKQVGKNKKSEAVSVKLKLHQRDNTLTILKHPYHYKNVDFEHRQTAGTPQQHG